MAESDGDPVTGQWRTGRKNPHTIYVQVGDQPGESDTFIGSLINPADVALVVAAVNAANGTARITEHLRRIERLITTEGTQIMAGQRDIDDAVAAIGAAVGDLTTQNSAIQAAQARLDQEIQALEAQVASGQPVDTTALVAAGQALADATSGLDATVNALANDPNVPPAPIV